uniref:Immunoglobulin domain-containing protein n=2 Tax=Esox lucius TaxID=8010 RepID=A0A6Q2XTW3_ESOLU
MTEDIWGKCELGMKRSMEKVFFCMVAILLALCPVGSEDLTVTGVVGGQVAIKCKHTFASNNDTYFCKDPCTSSDILIQTTNNKNYAEKGRYSIFDFKSGDVIVTIKDLNKSDSGTYWCGVIRVVLDSYQEVFLKVEKAPSIPPDITRTSLRPPVTVSTTMVTMTTGTPVVIIVCVGLAVLVLGLILLLFYKWRTYRKPRPVIKPDASTQDPTYQNLNLAPQDSTYQTLNPAPQDSTYQTLNPAPQDSTYQILNTTPQDLFTTHA